MGSLALVANDNQRAGVSIDPSVSYLRAVPMGSTITCIGKVGKSVGFTQVDIFHQGKLAATGRHTKFDVV
jgi:acyl-coenzyme A thioesterase PaaI-like protein